VNGVKLFGGGESEVYVSLIVRTFGIGKGKINTQRKGNRDSSPDAFLRYVINGRPLVEYPIPCVPPFIANRSEAPGP